MKRILIHSIVFYPDGVSTAYLYNDIVSGLLENGFQVKVLTTTPHYNYANKLGPEFGFIKRYFGLYYISYFKKAKIYHIPQKKYNSTFFRLLGFIYWHLASLIIGIFSLKFDLIITPSPPLTVGLVSIVMAKIKGAKSIYNVQEIYPDLLINQHHLKSKVLIACFKIIEKWVYNYSDMVITIDESFFNVIKSRIKNPAKLRIIPNFVDLDFFRPDVPYDGFLNGNYNSDNLRLMYAGNIGHAQNWELLIDLAKLIRDHPVDFYVIGDGVKKDFLNENVKKNNLENVKVFSYQDRNLMPGITSFADVHFIFMDRKVASQGFPSKIYTILACGKPIIISSTEDSPIVQFLKNYDVGFVATDHEIKTASQNIRLQIETYLNNRQLITNQGNNAVELVKDNYSKSEVIQKYLKAINALTV